MYDVLIKIKLTIKKMQTTNIRFNEERGRITKRWKSSKPSLNSQNNESAIDELQKESQWLKQEAKKIISESKNLY